jgi:hypothetical protein
MAEDQKWVSSVYAPSTHHETNEWARLLITVRDGHRCKVGGCKATRGLQPHHIWPREQGGTDDVDNLVLLCNKHHDEIEADGNRHSMVEIIGWGDDSSGVKFSKQPIAKPGDWQSWVYGGARNPKK